MSASPQFWIDAQLSPLWRNGYAKHSRSTPWQSGISDSEGLRILSSFAQVANERPLSSQRTATSFSYSIGAPPQVLWLTCGNTSNARLRALLAEAWPRVSALLVAGDFDRDQ